MIQEQWVGDAATTLSAMKQNPGVLDGDCKLTEIGDLDAESDIARRCANRNSVRRKHFELYAILVHGAPRIDNA